MCLFINNTCGSCNDGPSLNILCTAAAPEPDFQWTVDKTRRPIQLASMITWPQSSSTILDLQWTLGSITYQGFYYEPQKTFPIALTWKSGEGAWEMAVYVAHGYWEPQLLP
jgi:hypothetical protein